MIEIVKAIKTRWDAKSLDSTVSGGIWNSRPEERTAMPYCIFTEVSNTPIGETRCRRIGRYECQFDIYTDTGNPETSADMATTVRDTMVHSEGATADGLNPASTELANVRVSRDITTQGVGDEQVFRSTFTLVMDYTVSANRTPA
jgi:hypothetical protein